MILDGKASSYKTKSADKGDFYCTATNKAEFAKITNKLKVSYFTKRDPSTSDD